MKTLQDKKAKRGEIWLCALLLCREQTNGLIHLHLKYCAAIAHCLPHHYAATCGALYARKQG
jgi:hypothetical protein